MKRRIGIGFWPVNYMITNVVAVFIILLFVPIHCDNTHTLFVYYVVDKLINIQIYKLYWIRLIIKLKFFNIQHVIKIKNKTMIIWSHTLISVMNIIIIRVYEYYEYRIYNIDSFNVHLTERRKLIKKICKKPKKKNAFLAFKCWPHGRLLSRKKQGWWCYLSWRRRTSRRW